MADDEPTFARRTPIWGIRDDSDCVIFARFLFHLLLYATSNAFGHTIRRKQTINFHFRMVFLAYTFHR